MFWKSKLFKLLPYLRCFCKSFQCCCITSSVVVCLRQTLPNMAENISASSWDYGTYHIGDQRSLGWACALPEPSLFAHIQYGSGGRVRPKTIPTGWLRIRVWRMALQRTKSTIISRDDSFDSIKMFYKWAASWQNQQSGMCAQRRLRSAWASSQSDQSSLSAWRKLGSLVNHWARSEDWSDWADAQADQSLRWPHSHFVGFVMRQLKYSSSSH